MDSAVKGDYLTDCATKAEGVVQQVIGSLGSDGDEIRALLAPGEQFEWFSVTVGYGDHTVVYEPDAFGKIQDRMSGMSARIESFQWNGQNEGLGHFSAAVVIQLEEGAKSGTAKGAIDCASGLLVAFSLAVDQESLGDGQF